MKHANYYLKQNLKISGKVKLADYVRTYTVLAQSPEILNS